MDFRRQVQWLALCAAHSIPTAASAQGVLVTRSTPNPGFRRVDAIIAGDDGRHLVTLSTVLARP